MKKQLILILIFILIPSLFAQMRYGIGVGYSPSVNSDFNKAMSSQGFMGYLESGYIFNERYEPGFRFASSYLLRSSNSITTVGLNNQETVELFHGQFLNFSFMPYFRYFILHEKLLAKHLKPYVLAGIGLSLDYALLGTPENYSHIVNQNQSLQAAKYRAVDLGTRLAAGLRLKDFWDFSLAYHYGGTVKQKPDLSPNNITTPVKNQYSAHLMELTVGISLGKKKKKDLTQEEQEHQDIENQDLKNQDLKNQDLKNQDLKNQDLKNQDLKNQDLKNQDLKNQDLKNQDLKNQDLKNQDLKNQDLKNQDLKNQDLKNQDLKNQDLKSLVLTQKIGATKNDNLYQDFNQTKDSVSTLLKENERLFFLSTIDKKSFDKVETKIEIYTKKDKESSDKTAEVLEQFSTKSGEKYVKVDTQKETFAIITTAQGQEYTRSLQKFKGDDVVIFVDDPSQPDLALTENEVLSLTEYQAKIHKKSYFGFDRYDLTEDEQQKLDQIIELLKNNKNLMVILEGHTDAVGTDEYNNELSRKRVVVAVLYLRRNGVSKEQILFSFFGKYRLISKDPSINRRVEIRVVYKE